MRRSGAAVHAGRQLPRQVARAAHPLLARARSSGRRRAGRCRRPGQRGSDGRTPDGHRDGRTGGGRDGPRCRRHSDSSQKALASATAADEVDIPIEAALSRTLAGRALAMAGERERAVAELDTSRLGAACLRCLAVPGRGGTGTEASGTSHPPSHRFRRDRRARTRVTDRSGSGRSPTSSLRATPTPRSPRLSSSAPRPWRPTFDTSSTSSTSRRGSNWPARSSQHLNERRIGDI